MTTKTTLTVTERAALRLACRNHNGWKAYRTAHNIDMSNMNTTETLKACQALGIDVDTILNTTTNTETNTMKDRTFTELEFGSTKIGYSYVYHLVTPEEKTKADGIIKSVEDAYKAGRTTLEFYATKAQVFAIRTITENARKRELETATSTSTSTSATDTRTTTKPTTTTETAPMTITTAAIAPVAGDAAGAALANMVAPHILASLTDSITRLVEARLETVSTVRIEVAKQDGTSRTVAGHAHPKLATLMRVLTSRQTNGYAPNVLLVGPTGSGKTHAAHQAADTLDRQFYAQGSMAMTHELMGFIDAAGHYHRTPFRDAFENGGLVILDELDSWDQSCTLALNAALANGYAAFPDGMVKRHPDSIIIGAGNTHGTGSTPEYVGRNRLDQAFLSRFPVKIVWENDPALELNTTGNAEFARMVQAARIRAQAKGLKHLIDSRHMSAGAALIAQGFTMQEAAELTFLAGLNDEQKRIVTGA
jgi:cobaltochelatase CobS